MHNNSISDDRQYYQTTIRAINNKTDHCRTLEPCQISIFPIIFKYNQVSFKMQSRLAMARGRIRCETLRIIIYCILYYHFSGVFSLSTDGYDVKNQKTKKVYSNNIVIITIFLVRRHCALLIFFSLVRSQHQAATAHATD